MPFQIIPKSCLWPYAYNKAAGSLLNNDPDVKRCLLKPRSQGQPTGLELPFTHKKGWTKLFMPRTVAA